jgi:exonuclease SbcC
VTQSSLSESLAKSSEAERAVASVRSEATVIQGLLEDLPQFVRDASILADIQTRLVKAQNVLNEAEERQRQHEKGVQTARLGREALLPEYERAVAAQADIEKLLDSIQSHVHDKSCPLCGSEFDSIEALLERIRRQRNAVSQRQDVTTRYQSLVAKETEAVDLLRVTSGQVLAANATINELSKPRAAADQRLTTFRGRLATALIKTSDAEELRKSLTARQVELQKHEGALKESAEVISRDLKKLQATQANETARRRAVHERISALERAIQELNDRTNGLGVRVSQLFPGNLAVENDLEAEISGADKTIDEIVARIEELQATGRGEIEKQEAVKARKGSVSEKRDQLLTKLAEIHQSITGFRHRLRTLDVPDNVDAERLDRVVQQEQRHAEVIREVSENVHVIISALQARETRLQLMEKKRQLDQLGAKIAKSEEELRHIHAGMSVCESIEKLLKRERQNSVERHIAAYGPMITMIQQRLRSVYGFGGVKLEARGGETKVHVEWRNKSVQVPPTDFFSDSQRQILMLSIFLAGGIRQNWSGFAPVLLDDPVTHFDDLNAYGFVELVRGIIATSPNEWQFIISTCEERLFDLMQKKFSRLPSGAIFYEFLGMTEAGPIVERR